MAALRGGGNSTIHSCASAAETPPQRGQYRDDGRASAREPPSPTRRCSIQNKDANSYELVKACGSKTEDWSIAGGTTKKLSIPAGAKDCTITVKKTKTSCTVKDGEKCVIESSKISKKK